MQGFIESLSQAMESITDFEARVLGTIVVILMFASLRFVALRIVYGRVEDTKALYQWRKTLTYAFYLLGILAVGRIWIQGFASVSTFLGLLSAGVAVALRDPIVNLAGWMFIIWRRPFDVGDRVQIGDAGKGSFPRGVVGRQRTQTLRQRDAGVAV